MSQPDILDLVRALYLRMHGAEPDTATAAELLDVVEGNGLDRDPPAWLSELLAALVADEAYATRSLAMTQLVCAGFDVVNFFAELAPVADIARMHEGEYMVMSFDPLPVSVCVDFEPREGDAEVRLMRWPPGTGPHWERHPELGAR